MATFSLCSGDAKADTRAWCWAYPRPQGNNLFHVEWLDDRFIAVGDAGTILTSPNGIDWALRDSQSAIDLADVASDGTQFVAVGEAGTILTSSDGAHWTVRDSGTSNALQRIIWADHRFMAVGAQGTLLASANGIDWTSVVTDGFAADDYQNIAWNGSTFAIVTSRANILTSSDGLTWPDNLAFFDSTRLDGITWDGTQFIAVGGVNIFESGPTAVLTSADGLTWTPQDGETAVC